MLSIDEIIREVSSIKVSSDELSSYIANTSMTLSGQTSNIAALVRGSRTGQDAVMALTTAARGLTDAASSMRALSRISENCLHNLSK